VSFRERLGNVIFEADTKPGRLFDVLLLVAILASVLLVMLDSVAEVRARHGPLLGALEWAFTLLFTLEYAARVYSARERRRYVFSFYGVVDLLAILPTYLALLFPEAQYFLVIRSLRLLRMFRVLKLLPFLGEATVLARALHASRPKITVFLVGVLCVITIAGALLHVVEGPEGGFTNIPISMYWAIVTLTTVGYGDISPVTPLGRFLASLLMILGYGVIAVPTGIVTTELTRASYRDAALRCENCGRGGHDQDARHCKYCGEALLQT
jgi:voltage-gated potassium channel